MAFLLSCILTNTKLNRPISVELTLGQFISYDSPAAGKVNIAIPTLIDLMNKRQYNNPVLAGICRNASENGNDPPLITTEFILKELDKGKTIEDIIEKYKIISEQDLENQIKQIIKEKPNLNASAYMGLVMAKYRGKVDGKRVMELVKKFAK